MQPYYHDEAAGITIYQGDCLDVMPQLEPQSFDAVVCDLPYGTTACSWDVVIPFGVMWSSIKRLVKPRAAVVLFGSEPFSSHLRLSNLAWFKYDWVWDKHMPTGYLNAKHQPMRQHEIVSVFCDGKTRYNPIMRRGQLRTKGGMRRSSSVWGKHGSTSRVSDEYYPTSILSFSNAERLENPHPTGKPLVLLQYLIRTYTNPGDRVLDFTMGSGTTLEAAKIEGRRAVGIERDTDKDGNCLGYCEYAVNRLRQEVMVLL